MLRGEVRIADLDPSRGAESDRRRPVVIVSNDAANRTAATLGHGVLTVVPVTSNVERIYPFQILLPSGTAGLPRDSKAQAEQVRAIAVERIGERVGSVPSPLMASLDAALRLHLAL
jgi:mRNA interferase MazF